MEIVMKNLLKTQTHLAKTLLVTSCLALGGGAALAAETSASQASGASAHAAVTYTVRYEDLDVSSSQGAKILYLRIRYAAEMVCGSAASWGKTEGQACVSKAINDAVARINRPLLTQYQQQNTQSEKSGLVHMANAK
jgi:UrcA family protein